MATGSSSRTFRLGLAWARIEVNDIEATDDGEGGVIPAETLLSVAIRADTDAQFVYVAEGSDDYIEALIQHALDTVRGG